MQIIERKSCRFIFRPKFQGLFEESPGFGDLVGIAGANGSQKGGVGRSPAHLQPGPGRGLMLFFFTLERPGDFLAGGLFVFHHEPASDGDGE